MVCRRLSKGIKKFDSELMVCESKPKFMETKKFAKKIGNHELVVETGLFAGQANGSVTVRYGDTVIMANATMSNRQAEGIDYFPLMVEYEEKYYASGKINGSRFIKREGRPSDSAILTSRLIDRTIRPLFNQTMRNEVQVITSVLSYDENCDPSYLAVIAASLALGISDIPWDGPVAAMKITQNPKSPEMPVDFLVAGTENRINMIEADAKECPENDVQEIFEMAQKQIKEIVLFEKEIIKEIGKDKQEVDLTNPTPEFEKEIIDLLENNQVIESLYAPDKETAKKKKQEIGEILKNHLKEKFEDLDELKKRKAEANFILDEYLNDVFHQKVLEDNQRPDGRALDEVRKISCQVGLFPRTHGSGLFNRGETQALTLTTLGSPGAEQLVDTMDKEEKRHYMHHYNFPPYSVGEVRFLRGPGRREIGHGALAEKALMPVLPDREKFPYTIRVVSEILSSNGSSSMAATCGSTLSLMNAGVPIKKPVAGLAIGIVTEEKSSTYKILSDIQGPEDHWGDMDFKIAGTKDGINAIQLDVKIKGINLAITKEVLERSKENRLGILSEMEKAIAQPSEKLSPFAPMIITIKINPEKIRDVIGTGGKIINKIIEETGVEMDIEDDGNVFITAPDQVSGEKARKWVEDLTREAKVGEIFEGKVVRILDFGAFIELIPGQDGLLHISQVAKERVDDINKHLKVGQEIKVKVKEIDKQGRINLVRAE